MKEREINLVDLLVEILLHWRVFIVCMLAGGILFGALNVIRSNKAATETGTETEAGTEEGAEAEAEKKIDFRLPENRPSAKSMQNINWLTDYEAVCRMKEDYLKNLVLMKIDPDKVCKAEATIAIEAEDRQKSSDIEKVYENVMQSGELILRVEKSVNTKMTGIGELILFEGNRIGNLAGYVSSGATTEEATNVFRIEVKYADEAQCKKILETIIAFLKERQKDIADALGEHEITIVSTSFAVVKDIKIADIQKNNLDNIVAMKSAIANAKTLLSEEEQQYYDFLYGDDETEKDKKAEKEKEAEAEAASTETATPGISVKYIFLGMVMAAFLYAFLIFIIYIFNTKIRATDNLQELYDIPQLGMIPVEKESKKSFGFIDGKIVSIRNRDKRQFTPEEALELVSAAIKISAGKEALNEIYLIGCGLKERSLEACEKIKAYLEKDGIQAKILSNVLYDARAMEELENAKGVVLAESAGVVLYSEIAEELELLKRQGIRVLGGILME